MFVWRKLVRNSATLVVNRTLNPVMVHRRYSDTPESPKQPVFTGYSPSLSSRRCVGCGYLLQSKDSHSYGYLPLQRHTILDSISSSSQGSSESVEDPNGAQSDHQSVSEPTSVMIMCQRCTKLKHHNTALKYPSHPGLQPSEYREHIASLSDRKALVFLVVDAVDFPGSLFPDLHSVLGQRNSIHIIVNKIDLLPDQNQATFIRLEKYITKKSLHNSLKGYKVQKVWFVSSKSKKGIKKLCDWIVHSWGNRGDIYLLGCTNVGKSSLFHELMIELCGSVPGDCETVSGLSAPSPVISHWPGTTLDLISFPILSVGKRKRLLSRIHRAQRDELCGESVGRQIRDLFLTKRNRGNPGIYECLPDIDDVLVEAGLKKNIKADQVPQVTSHETSNAIPLNRRWLHDTPGAINDSQLINHLTTKELSLFLPKEALRPRTFILKPGLTLFLGGLARLDYDQGADSAYFIVFCPSALPLHATQTSKADALYERNFGKSLLKIPFGNETRLKDFPSLDFHSLTINGSGLKQSCCDIILSSIGWVAVTMKHQHTAIIKAFTPEGKGIWVRDPPLFPDAVNQRGRRSKKGNRAVFLGIKK